jgi:NTE family protein
VFPRWFRPLAILLVSVWPGLPSTVRAQNIAPAPGDVARTPPAAAAAASRPRIGLALGGGSARGLAHIGVLEWFEAHRIPIDYIAGTSMGGLVAGAYATGMSPGELRELMASVDWDVMFVADSPYKYKTFRRKQDRRLFPGQLELGLKNGVALPGGLNPGQQVTLLLDRIALPYYALERFDDLPTPYRCVATDLNKSETVVLGKGPLAQAMRATMAIPGVFTPVNYENWLLVDGGALNNIPANVVKELGADVVIAVDVSADADPAARRGEDSLLTLLGRTIDTMMTASMRTGLKAADVILDPDLKGLDSMAWRRSGDLADRGVEAAERMKEKLLPYALGEEEYRAFMAARAAKRRTATAVPTRVTVTGVEGREQAEIVAALQGALGAPLEWQDVSTDILKVTGSDRYEFLTYRLNDTADGTELRVHARVKRYGPPFLIISPELSNVDSTNFAVNLRGRITAYDWVGKGSETRVDLGIGTRQLAGVELYEPIGHRGFFVAPRAYFTRYSINGYFDERLQAEYRFKRTSAGLDLGYSTGRRSELRLGFERADVRGRIRVGSPFLPEVSGAESMGTLQFTFDGQNSPVVPSRGLFLRSRLRHYSDTPDIVVDSANHPPNVDEFWQGDVEGTWFKPVRRGRDRVFLRYGAGTSFGDSPLIETFFLGGPLRLGSLNNDELRAPNYLLGTAGYLKGIGRLPDVLGGSILAGAWFEQGTAYDDWADAQYRSSVSTGIIMETLFGPVFGGASVDFDGRYRLYISVGPLFR